MIDFHDVHINDKFVHKLYANGKLIFAAEPDARHLANEETYAVLSNDTVAETLTYNSKSYDIYDSIDLSNSWTAKGAGNVRPWIVSDSILMFAHHYPTRPAINYNVIVDGQTVNIKSLSTDAYVNLKEWCLENGFTEADFTGLQMADDVDMILCEQPSASLSSIRPYFMSEATMKKIFWDGNIGGVVGFHSSQATNYAIPYMFRPVTNDQYVWWATAASGLNDIKEDNLKELSAITSAQYPIYTGDSGKPMFFKLKGKDIVVSQCKSATTGPNLIKMFPFIKAFVEAHNDTINEFTYQMMNN